jgi:glycosyltransferase involved in cell wall biosynthesis
MRVLYSFPDAVGKPGIGWVALHQVQDLIDEGVEVDLWCTSLHPGSRVVGARRVVCTLAVGSRRIPHRALGVDRAYRYHDWRVARGVRRTAGELDLVHCWPRATLRTAAAAHRAGLPLIREAPNTHTAHAMEVVEREHRALGLPPAEGQTHVFDAGILALEEAEYAAADLILVPSELAERTFVERGVPAERLALHGYGFEPERFVAGDPVSDDGPLTVLFAARLEPRKGLHHALRAWHDSGLADRGRLIVCGQFVDGYREVVAPLLEHPSIELRGFVDDLEAVMREADVFVLPSIEEGSALVTYAAQGSGCVPVVSDAAGARCRHGEDGLVHEAGDVATLSEHLRMLDHDRALARRLAAAALETARTLTWREATRRLIANYERALGR